MKPAFELSWTGYLFLSWVLLTLLFTTLAPSASNGLSFVERSVFWAVHVACPLILLQIAQMLAGQYLNQFSDWVSVSASGFLGALAFVPVAWALDTVFPDDDDLVETWLASILSESASTVIPVMLVWVALNAPRLLRISEVPQSPSSDTPARDPDFLAKVPLNIGRDLVSLSAELHYLRVRTSTGDALILYPFGKAVTDLANASGLQVHRSHWVALVHIKDVERRGDGATVVMDFGPPLPVSRKFRKSLTHALVTEPAIRAEDTATGA